MLERLETALQRERDFVADAGHELRTPLALLRTELELALRHSDSADELKEAVRSSREEVERLAQLAEDLLLIARSDRGKLPLKLDELDASELLSAVANRFEWRAEADGRPLRTVAPAGFRVRGDRIRLEQALSNLVDNALRHGAGEVLLSATAEDGRVELHVTDAGAGFPLDFLDHAFERFARGDQARTRGGTGLGLSIVRVIAEAHGGSAHVSNGDPTGADVWIALPGA
jgi:signal transduction histidine kinase